MTDQFLSTLNTLLQWIAVVGTALALISGIGLIFARREISHRQAAALAVAHKNAEAAREEVERVKKYAYVATLTFNGMVYTGAT
jgi:hypothetical protein